MSASAPRRTACGVRLRLTLYPLATDAERAVMGGEVRRNGVAIDADLIGDDEGVQVRVSTDESPRGRTANCSVSAAIREMNTTYTTDAEGLR